MLTGNLADQHKIIKMEYTSIGIEQFCGGVNSAEEYTGKESATCIGMGIWMYQSEFDSTRFVKFVQGEPVSGIQVITFRGSSPEAANIFTREKHRRKRYATEVWNAAKRRFPLMVPSRNVGVMGRELLKSIL